MQEPIGVSGVQTVPNNRHSRGAFMPRRIAPHSQAGLSLARRLDEPEPPLCVEIRPGVLQLQRAVRQEAQAAPLETVAQLKHLRDFGLCARIAVARDGADIFVLDFRAALVDLAHQHQDRLRDVERLEAGDHDRLAIVAREHSHRAPCR